MQFSIKLSNKVLGIGVAVLVVLGYVVSFTTVFKAYFGYVTIDSVNHGVDHASPARMSNWCSSSYGQAAQSTVGSGINSVCGNATSWETFGSVLIVLGVVLGAIIVVRLIRARYRANQVVGWSAPGQN